MIDAILTDALTRFRSHTGDEYIRRDEIRWYAWPQMWGDTSCGSGSGGGQAITTAQVVAVEGLGMWAVYVRGEHRYMVVDPSPTFYEGVHENRLPGQYSDDLDR